MLLSPQWACTFHAFYCPLLSGISEQDPWQNTQEMIFAHRSNSSVIFSFIIDIAHLVFLSQLIICTVGTNLTHGIVRTSKITEAKCLAQAHVACG